MCRTDKALAISGKAFPSFRASAVANQCTAARSGCHAFLLAQFR